MSDTHQEGRKIIKIAVPSSNPWTPARTKELVDQLITTLPKVIFQIIAVPNKIFWCIEAPEPDDLFVTNMIYALYPQAECVVIPKKSAYVGYYQTSLGGANQFFAAFKMASQSKELDPLIALVGSLGNLQPQEAIIYELIVSQPTANYLSIFEKMVGDTGWDKFADFGARVLPRLVSGRNYIPTYTPPTPQERWSEHQFIEFQTKIMDKLSSMVCEVELRLKVKAADETRAEFLTVFTISTLTSLTDDNWIDTDDTFGAEDQEEHKVQPLILSTDEVASFWHLATKQMHTQGIQSASTLPQLTVELEKGIVLGTATHRGEKKIVRLDYGDRKTHINITGGTGMGKSTLMLNMIKQDIENGCGLSVIDPHNQLVDMVLDIIPNERKDDVILFDVSDTEYPIGLNLLARPQGVLPYEVAGQALAVIKKKFEKDWPGGRMEYVLSNVLRTLVNVPGATVLDVTDMLNDPQMRTNILAKVSDPKVLKFWNKFFLRQSPNVQVNIASPILTRVERFAENPVLEAIVGQPTSLNFRQIMDKKQIFLAKLAGGLSEIEAETLGTLLIAKYWMAATSRHDIAEKDRIPHYLYIDEVQHYTQTNLSEIFSQARKYKLSLTIANQYLSQLAGDTVKAVLGTVDTSIIFNSNKDDAKVVNPSLGEHISVGDITTMNTHAALVKMKLDKRTVPTFSMMTHKDPEPQEDCKAIVEYIITQSRAKYAKPLKQVNAEISARDQQPETKQTPTLTDAREQEASHSEPDNILKPPPTTTDTTEGDLSQFGDKKRPDSEPEEPEDPAQKALQTS